MGIVDSLFPRKAIKEKEEAAVVTAPSEPAGAKLMMLMPDASGIATYKLHTFASAIQAEAYLQSILRGEIQEGTIMFWGLTHLPPDDINPDVAAEPVVLISDPSRPGLVYTFSFVDLDSAYDFVRHEMKSGVHLAQTAIYLAAPAEVTADGWGQINVTPSRPPARQPASNSVAISAALTRFVARGDDEPRGTRLHTDETPTVRRPDPVPAEPEAVPTKLPHDVPVSSSSPTAAAMPLEPKELGAIEAWRSRQSDRFAAKEDPFSSFESPPGRF